MAAWTELDTFGGTGQLDAADGWTPAADVVNESGGAASANSNTVDAAISWASTIGDSSTSVGGAIRAELGAMTAGSEIRLYFRATAADDITSNRYYVKIKKASLSRNGGTRDELEIWKIVSGTHTQITNGLTQRSEQGSYGDMRNYGLAAGDSVTVCWAHDQIWVKFTGTDQDQYDSGGGLAAISSVSELIHLHVQDSSISAAGYAGIWFVAGASHTNSVQRFQGQAMTTKWISPSGNDSTGSGTQASPWRSFAKLFANVGRNQIGVAMGGAYTDSFNSYAIVPTPVSGTSYEDAPIYCGAKGGAMAINTGYIGIQDDNAAGDHFEFMVLHNIKGQNGTPCFAVWSQDTTDMPKDIRCQGLEWSGSSSRGFDNSVWSTLDTVDAYTSRLHLIDCSGHDNGVTNAHHGFYGYSAGVKIEYCTFYNNAGDGLKMGRGSVYTTFVCNDLVIRYNTSYNNAQKTAVGTAATPANANNTIGSGINIYTANGYFLYSNNCYDNDSGIFLWKKNTGGKIFNNTSWNNWSNGLYAFGDSGGTNTSHVVYHNTFFDNGDQASVPAGLGHGIKLHGLVTSITFKNNSSYSNKEGSYTEQANGGDSPSSITIDYNHEATDTGFKGTNGVTGDPLYSNQSGGDARLQATSPLIGAGTDLSLTFDFDFDRRPGQTGDPTIGAFKYPDPPVYDPIVTMDTTRSLTVSISADISVVITDPDASGNLVVQVTKTGDMTVTKPTASGATVRGFN